MMGKNYKINSSYKMPDESCRNCGNSLYVLSKCKNCGIIFQEICLKCGKKPLPRIHYCITISQNIVAS